MPSEERFSLGDVASFACQFFANQWATASRKGRAEHLEGLPEPLKEFSDEVWRTLTQRDAIPKT